MSYSWTIPSASAAENDIGIALEEQGTILGKDILFDGDFHLTASRDYVLLEGIEALRQSIYRRLLTRPGEFRARPEYGVGVLSYVKRRLTQGTLDELRQAIVDQLSIDTRIDGVTEVVVEPFESDGVKIAIGIEISGRTLRFRPFDFRESVTVGSLGLREGTL